MTKDDFYSHIQPQRIARELKKHHGPCFLCFGEIISYKHELLKHTLPPFFVIHYAFKANPNPEILAFLAGRGIGGDVASGGELEAALACGMKAGDIEFSGPGKTSAELEAAVRAGIGSINVESLSEIEILADICVSLARRANVGVRINPINQGGKSNMKMAGATQFGIPEEDAASAIELILSNSDCLDFTGIHVHTGSQLLKAEAIVRNFTVILDLALDIEDECDIRLAKLNFGGGWGIGYFPNHGSLDTDMIREELALLFDDPDYAGLASHARMIVEPGRFLVGESGIYATRILYHKHIRGKEFAIVDGGMHHHYLLAGGMGQVIRQNFEIDIFPEAERSKVEPRPVDIAGCLCTPQDLLATGYNYDRDLAPGDNVIFFNSGAYGPSASPSAFLSHAQAEEVLVH